eukprot:scaffold27522_cov62-Phaeocystis_antarctica.AAC.1
MCEWQARLEPAGLLVRALRGVPGRTAPCPRQRRCPAAAPPSRASRGSPSSRAWRVGGAPLVRVRVRAAERHLWRAWRSDARSRWRACASCARPSGTARRRRGPAPPVVHHTARGMYGAPEAGARTAYVPQRTSCPVPQVRTLRRRPVRAACTYSTEPPGRTCQQSAPPQPRAPSSCCYRLARADKLARVETPDRTRLFPNSRLAKFVPRARSTRETRGRPQGRLPARERNVHAEESPHERAEGVQGGRVRGRARLLQAYAQRARTPDKQTRGDLRRPSAAHPARGHPLRWPSPGLLLTPSHLHPAAPRFGQARSAPMRVSRARWCTSRSRRSSRRRHVT